MLPPLSKYSTAEGTTVNLYLRDAIEFLSKFFPRFAGGHSQTSPPLYGETLSNSSRFPRRHSQNFSPNFVGKYSQTPPPRRFAAWGRGL